MSDEPTPAEGEPGHPYGSAPWITRRDEQIEQIKEQPTPPDVPETRPRLTLAELVDSGTNDGDYCDGDHSGYHSATLENGVLTFDYEADEFSQNDSTRAQFVEVGALLAALRQDPVGSGILPSTWRRLISLSLGTEIHAYPYGPARNQG